MHGDGAIGLKQRGTGEHEKAAHESWPTAVGSIGATQRAVSGCGAARGLEAPVRVFRPRSDALADLPLGTVRNPCLGSSANLLELIGGRPPAHPLAPPPAVCPFAERRTAVADPLVVRQPGCPAYSCTSCKPLAGRATRLVLRWSVQGGRRLALRWSVQGGRQQGQVRSAAIGLLGVVLVCPQLACAPTPHHLQYVHARGEYGVGSV